MTEMKILLVEDDNDLRESLMDCFHLSGFPAVSASSAREFYRLLISEPVSIAIIDVGLPDEDGFSIARFLREQKPETGIIMLTARGTAADRVKGFQQGADIYLIKPVEYPELEAAIQSLSRRLPARTVNQGKEPSGNSGWFLDRVVFSLSAPNGKRVNITNREARLLTALLETSGALVLRADLLQALGYRDDEFGQRSLNAVVVRLRAKVEDQTGLPLPLSAVRGQGYVIRDME